MRLVITSDTHFPVNDMPIPDGDVFIHSGDFMYTGYPDEWNECIAWMGRLPHKTKLLIPGNHDWHLLNYQGQALYDLWKLGVQTVGFPGSRYGHTMLPNGMSLLGLPFVTNLNLWAFNTSEEYIERYLQEMGKHDVIVSHSPVRGFLDQVGEGKYRSRVGVKAYKKYLDFHKPVLWASGHIHEGYGQVEHEGTVLVNASMCNKEYQQVNPPIVIDLPD